VARVEVVRDTYFGDTVSDLIVWMENAKIPIGCVLEGRERSRARHSR